MREQRSVYRLEAGREGLRVAFDEEFFDNQVIRKDGTTRLDIHVASLVQEIRTALYLIGTVDLPKH